MRAYSFVLLSAMIFGLIGLARADCRRCPRDVACGNCVETCTSQLGCGKHESQCTKSANVRSTPRRPP